MNNINKEEKQRRKRWITISSLLTLTIILVAAIILVPIAFLKDDREETFKVIDLKFERINPVFNYEENVLDSKIIVIFENETQTSISLEDVISEVDKYQLKLVGKHTITPSYNGFSKQIDVTITPAEFSEEEISKIIFSDQEVAESSEGYFFSVENIPIGSSVEYYINEKTGEGQNQYLLTDPGKYKIIAVIEKPNYNPLTIEFNVTINP